MEAKTFYTPAQVEEIRLSAKRLGMLADPRYWNASADDLAQICNGYGPDMWSDSERGSATWIYRNFAEAATIHDFDFKFSDGKPETLRDVNARFARNNSLKLAALYPMSKPWLYGHRAVAWCKITAAYEILVLGSDAAWKSAHDRYSREDCAYCDHNHANTCMLRMRDVKNFGWCRNFRANV